MNLSLKFDTDFDFYTDKTNKFLSFIFGFFMYSVTIAIMSGVFTQNLVEEWSSSLNGHMTVEFQSNVDGTDEALTEKQREEVFKIIKTTPGIKYVKQLHDSDILKVLEPWLKNASIPDDFPFPIIFDVESEQESKVDLLSLTEKLSKISNGVKIHDHANWYAPIFRISLGLFSFSVLLSVFVFITVCIAVVFITKKTLNAHKNVVRILQLIGASSRYIAAQFKMYYFDVGLKASLMSIVFSALTIFGITFITSSGYDQNLIKYVLITLLVPVFMTIVIMITSQKSVTFFLNNDDWSR